MVTTINKASARAVNVNSRYPTTSYVTKAIDLSTASPKRRSKSSISKLVAVFDTSFGPAIVTTRAPNEMKKELSANFGSVRLLYVSVPPSGLSAESLISNARRALRLKRDDGTMQVDARSLIRAVRFASCKHTLTRIVDRKRKHVAKAVRTVVANMLTV